MSEFKWEFKKWEIFVVSYVFMTENAERYGWNGNKSKNNLSISSSGFPAELRAYHWKLNNC